MPSYPRYSPNGHLPKNMMLCRFIIDISTLLLLSSQRLERGVFIPTPPTSPVKVIKAIPNVIVGSDILLKKDPAIRIRLRDENLQTPYAAQFIEKAASFHIGAFFGEWRKQDQDVALAQGVFYSLAIQSHRRALGLANRSVYGTIMVNGKIKLMVSCWDDQILVG